MEVARLAVFGIDDVIRATHRLDDNQAFADRVVDDFLSIIIDLDESNHSVDVSAPVARAQVGIPVKLGADEFVDYVPAAVWF